MVAEAEPPTTIVDADAVAPDQPTDEVTLPPDRIGTQVAALALTLDGDAGRGVPGQFDVELRAVGRAEQADLVDGEARGLRADSGEGWLLSVTDGTAIVSRLEFT